MKQKAFSKLTVDDIKNHPVWEFSSNGRSVIPIRSLPVKCLTGRAVGVEVTLANQTRIWAILTNVSLDTPEYNPHLTSARLDVSGEWFDLGRYFDADYEDRTPRHFSELMGLSVNEAFPISYDLSSVAIGTQESLVGEIPAVVERQLPLSELMKFVVRNHAP